MAQAIERRQKKKALKHAAPARLIAPNQVIGHLEKHLLVDGFKLVFDLEKSHGSIFVDASSGREFIDLYAFYASQPIGFNDHYFDREDAQADLLSAAENKIAKADIYISLYPTFVETFALAVRLPSLRRNVFV